MNAGIDVGYSAVKGVTAGASITFPSVVGTPDKARFSVDGAGRDITLSIPGDGTWRVGEGAVEQSRFVTRREDRGWIRSDTHYRLFLAALTELTSATVVDLVVVTGLPLAYYDDRDTLRDRILGEHRVARDGRRAQRFKVSDCRVIPQPFGTLLSVALDNQGHIVDGDLATGAVGVVDVGGKTTNLLSVSQLAEVSRETASVDVGAWDVARQVRGFLEEHYPDLELRDHQVIEAMVKRSVRYYGQPVDLGAVVDGVLEPLADQVIAQATQLWGSGAGLQAILVTGGGAHLLGSRLTAHFRHARIADEPVMANARGYWRFAQRLRRPS